MRRNRTVLSLWATSTCFDGAAFSVFMRFRMFSPRPCTGGAEGAVNVGCGEPSSRGRLSERLLCRGRRASRFPPRAAMGSSDGAGTAEVSRRREGFAARGPPAPSAALARRPPSSFVNFLLVSFAGDSRFGTWRRFAIGMPFSSRTGSPPPPTRRAPKISMYSHVLQHTRWRGWSTGPRRESLRTQAG